MGNSYDCSANEKKQPRLTINRQLISEDVQFAASVGWLHGRLLRGVTIYSPCKHDHLIQENSTPKVDRLKTDVHGPLVPHFSVVVMKPSKIKRNPCGFLTLESTGSG